MAMDSVCMMYDFKELRMKLSLCESPFEESCGRLWKSKTACMKDRGSAGDLM